MPTEPTAKAAAPLGGSWVQQVGALFTGLGVALGAFGAHLLEARISADAMATYETAVLYHLVHGIALVAIGFAIRNGQARLVGPARLLLFGATLFTGVLYGLALGGPRVLGAIAPIGGSAMIVAWVWLALRSRP